MKIRKKILFFTPSDVGGAERVTLTIAKMLPRSEYEVKIVFVCEKVGDLKKFVPQWMLTIHIKIRNIWDFVSWRMYCLIKREHPYAVFSSLHYLNPRTILSARIAGVKNIIIRNNTGWSAWRPDIKMLAWLTYGNASAIVLQSDEMKSELQKVFPHLTSLMRMIPNPIDTEIISERLKNSENPFIEGTINFIYCGRVHPIKGLDTLIIAFANVQRTNANLRLTIVGNHSKNLKYYRMLQSLISNKHLEECIDFVGFQDNPYPYMKYADCFVLPSRREGNPNVLHEAMWLQVPVVATRSVPIIDRIVTPERGYVVDVDDVKALGYAMIKTLKMKIVQPYHYEGNNSFVGLFK